MADRPLTGTVALVTGASSAVGVATALRLATEGAAVALLARQGDRLDTIAADIEEAGGASQVIGVDITDPRFAEAAVSRNMDRIARLDLLVNNAAIIVLGTTRSQMRMRKSAPGTGGSRSARLSSERQDKPVVEPNPPWSYRTAEPGCLPGAMGSAEAEDSGRQPRLQ